MHFVNKKFKYGYSLDDGTSTIVSPPNLKKIVLTQQNPKFLFYGTRTEILEWMEKNKDIIIEYESDNLSKSTSSPPTPSVLSSSDSNKDNNFFINSPTKTTISPESTFLQNYKNIDNDNAITFNLYGIISDELVSCKPLNFAINYLTCFDVLLEIFPTNLLNKDYKKYLPIKTTILPSGIDLQSVSRELEQSWKQTSLNNHCDNLLSKKYIPIIKKAKSANPFKDDEGGEEKRRNSFSEVTNEKSEMFEVEEDINNYSHKPFSLRQYGSSNSLLDWISTKPPTFYSHKNREASASSKSTPIPPVVNLPLYEHSHDDLLLERGSSMKRNNLL
nr:14938_t:CDS:2 [Entrophospora candida]